MTRRSSESSHGGSLRERAEALAKSRAKAARQGRPDSEADRERLIHELRVHQIELELQNEELVRARAELEESLARYADLYEFAPVGYLTVDAAGTISQANFAAARMLDIQRAGLIGRPLQRFVAEASRASVDELLATHSGATGTGTRSADAYTPGADPRVLRFTASVASSTGECRLAISDVTEQRLFDQQRARERKLKSTTRLAGTVAHDFNNILTAVAGFVEIALLRMERDHPAAADLNQAKVAAERATELARRLLVLAGRAPAQPHRLDLSGLIRQLADSLQATVGEHVELRTRLADDLRAVRADPVQIEQALTALALNARDAMPNGGQLTIETANEPRSPAGRATASDTEPQVVVTITDTGHGMDQETLGHLFEPFYTTKQAQSGAGLGLATVHGIVQQLGGAIAVRSESGAGTTLTLRFPALADVVADKRPRISRGAVGGETILVVDDTPQLLSIVLRVLSDAGYRVITAADGVEALRIWREVGGNIALVLTDIKMPKMSGVELGKALQELRPGIKILFMSGYFDEAVDPLPSGAAFLQKPFTPVELAARVREVLDAGMRPDAGGKQ